jgi:hypothetical protein
MFMVLLFATHTSHAQKFTYEDAWSAEGFSLTRSDGSGLEISYSIHEFTLTDFDLKGEKMKQLDMSGNFLPNNAGAPDLPGNGRYIAVPLGAEVSYTITAERVEKFENITIAPAPRIPLVNDEGPLHYEKDNRIFQRNAFYPEQPVQLSEKYTIRGLESVIIGITPFQYNPVSKELLVYRDLKVNVSFKGGSNSYSDNRLRSRWFDPILSDIMMNFSSLPEVTYPVHSIESLTPDYEYVIICPDDPTFVSWAEELALFRNMQGIRTGIFTTTDIGGNNGAAIESFIDEAYNTWALPPVAVLLLGDYGTEGNTIFSPLWDAYCRSDNIYADVVNNDDLPDIIFARMTAQDETHLETMITKVINYETNPPTNPDFYDHPISALGWQTDRWFQLCSETVAGYFSKEQGKNPVRINAVCDGNPLVDPWSTAQNTDVVLDYFGPDGLGYIPATPQELGGFTGGTAADVEDAINEGAFMLMHRDHGYELGWGDPDFSNANINNLTNSDLCYVLSINCMSGRFDYFSECFAEKFHRHTYNGNNSGALGIIGATANSYSFVNDAYVWGLYDHLWTDFMPDVETEITPRGLMPAFANAAGKYFLEQSNWPYNTTNKPVTYHLFHAHGGAFSSIYSEVPMNLSVVHENALVAGLDQFNITADDGALIALSIDGEILATATGTGSEISIPIAPQYPPTIIDVVVTKPNYLRYQNTIQLIPPDGPYIIQNDVMINDENGNNNGMMDHGEPILLSLEVKNVGNENGDNVEVTINTDDPYITITQNQANYGTVSAGATKVMDNAFAIEVAGNIPDLHTVIFDVEATDGTEIWESSFFLKGHAPVIEIIEITIDDASSNNNGFLDPGETANLLITIENNGSGEAYNLIGNLLSNDPFITINTTGNGYGNIPTGEQGTQSYNVTADIITSAGYPIDLSLAMTDENEFDEQDSLTLIVGRIPALILDLEGTPKNSGPQMKTAIQNLGMAVDYATNWPEDLSKYSNIFVCLGIYPSNHQLTNAEGQLLADFIELGGNVYMEGGDTWEYDEPTPVHSLFHIEGLGDGGGNLDILKGMVGAFTEGMEFIYGGDNNYIDSIAPRGSAFNIFENNLPPYYASIAFDTVSYKTIGCSFEFGGLINGSDNNTKIKLMEKYLGFFGFRVITESPDKPEGEESVCPNTNTVYSTSFVEGADLYYWTIEPENAGAVNGTDTAVSITWSADFQGLAEVSVSAMNTTGLGPVSEVLQVDVMALPLQASTPQGPETVNTDEHPASTYTTTGSENADNYEWQVTPQEAYSEMLPDGLNVSITWSSDYTGVVELKVKGINACGEGSYSDALSVMLENSFGIAEDMEAFELGIYPNPNEGAFTLELSNSRVDQVNILIMNATGNLVYEQYDVRIQADYSVSIDISNESEGLYMMLIESDLGLYTRKVIIHK